MTVSQLPTDGRVGLIEVAQSAADATTSSWPAWFDQDFLGDIFSTVHWEFLLTGGWSDYVDDRTAAVDWIGRALAVSGDPPYSVVVSWSPARPGGWSFLAPSMKNAFAQIMGIEDQSAKLTEAERASLRDQGVEIPDGPQLPRGERAAIECLVEFLRRAPRNSAIGFIEAMEIVCPAKRGTDVMTPDQSAVFGHLTTIGMDTEHLVSGNPLILVAPSPGDVHKQFRHPDANVRHLRIGYPTTEDRLAFILEQLQIERNRDQRFARGDSLTPGARLEPGFTPQDLAAMTASLYCRHIEDIFLRSRANGSSVVTRELVRGRKREIIAAQFSETLEEMEPNVDLDDIGGQFRTKGWLDRNVFRPVQIGRPDLMKKAIVLLGPGGTGKTYMARAIAKKLGWNMVEFKQIKDMWVGSSEKLTDEAFEGILAMAPVVLFIDELDQKFSRGSGSDGGSSVEKYIFARLMEFLSRDDINGRVFTVANTNRPDLCDPALFRVGRFDSKVPILPPESDAERADLVGVLLKRRADCTDADLLAAPAPLADIARLTDGWTQAEIDGAVRDAARDAVLDQTSVIDALLPVVQSTRSTTGDVEYMTLLAVRETADNNLLPEKYQRKVANPTALREELNNLRPAVERDVLARPPVR